MQQSEVRRVNNVLRFFETSNITEITTLSLLTLSGSPYNEDSKKLKDSKTKSNHGGNVESKTASKK